MAQSRLVCEWTFDSTNGSSVFDTSGNANHGTLSNGAALVPRALVNQALALVGNNDILLIPSSVSLSVSSAATFSFSFKAADTLSASKSEDAIKFCCQENELKC